MINKIMFKDDHFGWIKVNRRDAKRLINAKLISMRASRCAVKRLLNGAEKTYLKGIKIGRLVTKETLAVLQQKHDDVSLDLAIRDLRRSA